MRWNGDPERLTARSAAAAAAPALPVGRGHARARAAVAALALPLAVAAVAVAAALPGAVGHALYGDEVASARIVTEPGATDVLRHVRRTESTPPAWYVVAWAARKATGADVQSLRLLSVLFAAAAAALTALWALRLLGSRPAAALAGSLVALGSVPAEYAEQLRAYALVVLVSVVFGLLLAESALRPARRWLIGLAAATWLGVLTHYFFAFVVLAGIVWLWAARPRSPGAARATIAIAAGTVAFMPWLPGFLEQQAHGRYRWIGPFDVTQVVTLPGELFFGPDGLFYGLARLAVTAAVLAGAVHVWWRREEATVAAALGLLPIAGAALVWAAGQPIFNERNMLPVAPFLAILVAAGVKALPARLVPTAAAIGVVAALAGAAYAETTLGRVPYVSVARSLNGLGWTSRDALIVDYPTVSANRRGVGIQITSAASWYLPGRPLLLWAPGRHGCRTRFAIVQTPDARSWLARAGSQVTAARVFTYYDHPILGRPRGQVVVARFRRPTRLPGAFYYALGERVACRR
jgi:4-amino-4-deoxy-L-arabinose transferase-like glycosyltransferase